MKELPFTTYANVVECPNFAKGRNQRKPTAIVIHKPEGNIDSVIPYLQDPKTEKSYHYVIALDGRIIQLVNPDDTAWHTGVVISPTWRGIVDGVNPNEYTIGIALEGFAASPSTEAQHVALVKLVADLATIYDFPITDESVVFHREIQGEKACPGYFLNKFYICQAAKYCQDALNTTRLQQLAAATS